MGNIIAVDLGGSKLVVGLVSPEGTVLHSATAVLTGVPFTREALLDMIDTCVKAINFKAGHPDAAAVGVSVPGAAAVSAMAASSIMGRRRSSDRTDTTPRSGTAGRSSWRR